MTAGRPGYQLDASAVLAVMLDEPGNERVCAVIDRASIHAVNVAEVVAKLIRAGATPEKARGLVEELQLHVGEELGFRQAADCGALIAATRKLGLSLGDCVCLTCAAASGKVAMTAERRWKELEGRKLAGAPVRVELIR